MTLSDLPTPTQPLPEYMSDRARDSWVRILTRMHQLMTTPTRIPLLRMLERLMPDTWEGQDRICGLSTAPAAKGNHHSEEGGLLRHTMEMIEFHLMLKRNLQGSGLPLSTEAWPHLLSDDRVILGVMIHDLHKAYKHFRWSRDNGGPFEYTDDAKLFLTPNQKTVSLLMEHGVSLDTWQLNALEHSEGGWAENPPEGSTVLAKYLYLLDELSGNFYDRLLQQKPLFGLKGRPMPFPSV